MVDGALEEVRVVVRAGRREALVEEAGRACEETLDSLDVVSCVCGGGNASLGISIQAFSERPARNRLRQRDGPSSRTS